MSRSGVLNAPPSAKRITRGRGCHRAQFTHLPTPMHTMRSSGHRRCRESSPRPGNFRAELTRVALPRPTGTRAAGAFDYTATVAGIGNSQPNICRFCIASPKNQGSRLAGLQREASFVEAGDLLFPEGGYQLSPAGRAELSNNIVPKLTGLQNAKVVVYGYNDNLTLSSRRAGDVVTYLVSQGINPNIISAKGFGDTHPVAPNDTPANRAKNRRIEITVQGPGAPGA